jgi:integrase
MWISDRHQNTRMGANSVAKTYKLHRTVMESALDAGLIVRNPCRIKGAGTERLPEMRCATVEEVAAITQAVEPRWQALILLAAYSGLRWGELAGLRRRYLDPLRKTVRVVEQCTEVNGHFVWGPPRRPLARGPSYYLRSSATSWSSTWPAGASAASTAWSS